VICCYMTTLLLFLALCVFYYFYNVFCIIIFIYQYCYFRPNCVTCQVLDYKHDDTDDAVNTVPPKVRNLRFVNIGTHFVVLAWDVAAQDTHAVVTHDVTYDVTYFAAEDSAPENASLVVTRHPNITLDGLLPQTKYAFRASLAYV